MLNAPFRKFTSALFGAICLGAVLSSATPIKDHSARSAENQSLPVAQGLFNLPLISIIRAVSWPSPLKHTSRPKPTPQRNTQPTPKPSPKPLQPSPFDDRGTPGGTNRSQSALGPCPAIPEGKPPLVALVPSFEIETVVGRVEQPFGLTTAAYPSFWFYIPYASQSKRVAEFVLIDEQEEDVYNFLVELRETPGMVQISLPKTRPGLQVGKRYRWVFSIICSRRDRSGDMTVNGWIERIQPDANLTRQLQQVIDPQQRLVAYADRGVWFDAFTTLAELRRQQPNPELDQAWRAFLESIQVSPDAREMEVLVKAPLSPCCQPETQRANPEKATP